jgi:hypothetical protein
MSAGPDITRKEEGWQTERCDENTGYRMAMKT